ncbi:minor capsid protein [Edaphobacillus lindanitolerans]|uniref:Phage putative head morphogenesis protein, SPP1 gp7 family n=1 Tax=Edaphobacillus lindanitolerans TaxID=550447 RepID=A0A1U7PTC9_9BACI|nr:minor capsid protein [Edaphobacillus lindanitolerans]SIT91653.1 phage putative head morphogenesis protein, SPP1 gp7 family [Edaphobacillus lindanitolerans]
MAESYWVKRERENMKRLNRSDAEMAAVLDKEYRRTLDEVQSLIDAFYSWYSDKEGISLSDARMRVQKLDMEKYEDLAKKYIQTKDLSPIANRQMRLYNLTMKVNRLELLQEHIRLELILLSSKEEMLLRKASMEEARREFERQAGILGQTLNANEKLFRTIADASFHGAHFSDRIWANHEALKSTLNQTISAGIVQGRSSREMASVIKDRFKVSAYQAQRLAQTEFARVQIAAQEESYKQGGIERYEYLAWIDNRTSHYCRSLNGKVFKVKDMQPGVNAPPMHPHCRSSTIPIVE